MPKTAEVHDKEPLATVDGTIETAEASHSDITTDVSGSAKLRPSGTPAASPEADSPDPSELRVPANSAGKPVPRGLTTYSSTTYLRKAIRLRVLLLVNRFRVIRTIDVAVACFSDRTFKAALIAAQRAMRSLVKEKLVRRHKTERSQTVYGLTERGAAWLEEQGLSAASSVRRVLDMTNPEHRLWAQFLVLASEARGLQAETEQDLMKALNKGKVGAAQVQGLLDITRHVEGKDVKLQLRPDAVAYEPDGITWFEVDRSRRGDRTAALAALMNSVGVTLVNGKALRRVVVFCKTERIERGALAVLRGIVEKSNDKVLIPGRCHYKEAGPGTWAVWRAIHPRKGSDCVDIIVGHIIVQPLPVWLPKVRIDSRSKHRMDGWFEDNYLPYRRPSPNHPWMAPISPLLAGAKSAEVAPR